ncbi:MAG TPA: alpha-L-rhamnosidase [Acidobacteriaceae bacterium]|jgi:hypothetical protein
MKRREFLRGTAMGAGALALTSVHGLAANISPASQDAAASFSAVSKFPDSNPKWRLTWDAAHAVLAANVKHVPRYDEKVLFEGAVYPGIWQECGPHEGLVYATLTQSVPYVADLPSPFAVARANHMAFFALQREDGQLPASIKLSEAGFGQIQMVVPIAATAWELAQITRDSELLETAYTACSRWDAWLRRYRDTRGTGLVEGFCTYDTGHDNSPRWKGVSNRCPEADARKFAPNEGVPRLCPDLSATVYGGRIALAAMAQALGKKGGEEARWLADAEKIRKLILEKLYSPEDAAFYDVDTSGRFVRVRGDVISRVLGEHVLKRDDKHDRHIFDDIWSRQLHNPKAFWTPYPFPSIAEDDPAFVRPIPRNSWGGASQALTALRAPRWMEHYGKGVEMRTMMHAWVDAISRSGTNGTGEFRQQMDPMTGEFTMADPSGYSPAALVYLDFIRRLGA